MAKRSQEAKAAAYERTKAWRARHPWSWKKQWERDNAARKRRKGWLEDLRISREKVEKPGIEVEGF